MKKREVTDEMVERAYEAGPAGITRLALRKCIDAALNPPAEPEIEVTGKMLLAASKVWSGNAEPMLRRYTALYRAMERVRREESKFKATHHQRHTRGGEEPSYWSHHRMDDPK